MKEEGPRKARATPGAGKLVDTRTIRVYHVLMDHIHTITMDSAGRLVIPAAVRRELALVGGAELAIDVSAGTIVLKPTATAVVAARGRLLVVRSALTGPVPDHRDVREERAEVRLK